MSEELPRHGCHWNARGAWRRTPIVLLLFFAGLLLVGIALDEPSRVLEQARSLCLSCIGIG